MFLQEQHVSTQLRGHHQAGIVVKLKMAVHKQLAHAVMLSYLSQWLTTCLSPQNFQFQWALYIQTSLKLTNSTFFPHRVIMWFVWKALAHIEGGTWLTVFEKMVLRKILKPKGGRTRNDKIVVVAGNDIISPTSKTQVCRTHRPTKSLSSPARSVRTWFPLQPNSLNELFVGRALLAVYCSVLRIFDTKRNARTVGDK
jgi:hypothetical protein